MRGVLILYDPHPCLEAKCQNEKQFIVLGKTKASLFLPSEMLSYCRARGDRTHVQFLLNVASKMQRPVQLAPTMDAWKGGRKNSSPSFTSPSEATILDPPRFVGQWETDTNSFEFESVGGQPGFNLLWGLAITIHRCLVTVLGDWGFLPEAHSRTRAYVQVSGSGLRCLTVSKNGLF